MPSVKPIITEHSTEWHWWAFSDFCKLKAQVKEPSPHMQMIGNLTTGKSVAEKIWFSGLYANFYNIPTALVMWEEWPWSRAKTLKFGGQELYAWLKQNWKGLATRIERRTVRTIANMYQCLMSYTIWAELKLPKYLGVDFEDKNAAYDMIWKEAEHDLRFMGRYIIIRLLEAMHRFADLRTELYDIRSIGGWSPKRALGLLYPEHIALLLSPDTQINIAKVDKIAFEAIEKFATDYDIRMSPYVFAAMLCEYRVAYENRHQYPGWTIDQEPAYWFKIQPYWAETNGPDFTRMIGDHFYNNRKALFPEECLGEIHGWHDTRVEPRKVLRDHGYNWIDTKYDYLATVESGDFSKPVLR